MASRYFFISSAVFTKHIHVFTINKNFIPNLVCLKYFRTSYITNSSKQIQIACWWSIHRGGYLCKHIASFFDNLDKNKEDKILFLLLIVHYHMPEPNLTYNVLN